MEIITVKNGRDLREFILLPWKIYKNDPAWVPPLISEVEFILNQNKNPFWKHAEGKLFLVKKEGKAVGRVAGIIDHLHIDYRKEKAGFFGFFESFKDYEIAELLLSTVKTFLKEKGMEIMRGPLNPTTNEECGTLIKGFDSSPYIMMTHNPPYYSEYMERFGLGKAVDWYAYLGEITPEPPKEVLTAAKFAAEKCPKVRVRPGNMRKFDEEVQKIKEVYNSAWSKNWGFVPFTDEEIISLAKRLRPLAIPELILFAEIEGKPIGVLVGIPNFNQALKHLNGRLFPFGFLKALYYGKKVNTSRLIIMGIKEEYRRVGIEALLYFEALKAANRLGFKWFEASMILEQNLLTRKAAELVGGNPYKTYRIFEMRI